MMMWQVDCSHHYRSQFEFVESNNNRIVARTVLGLALSVTTALLAVGFSRPAQALPSFARQTGQPCGTCHTDFPGLTPYGRLFKLNGYTTGGGPFRTTLFSAQNDSRSALAAYAGKLDSAKNTDGLNNNSQSSTSSIWVPPLSMMVIEGYTHTQASQLFPTCGGPYKCNDNAVTSPLSFFYGGAITDHIGAFAQVTYNNAPFGALWAQCLNNQSAGTACDPYQSFQWSWDNTDIRYANTVTFGKHSLIFGVTANNNPSVQDAWNTTPAWKFPFAVSNVAPSPATSTFIDGQGPGSEVGVGGYLFLDNLLYLELTGYSAVPRYTQTKFGIDPYGAGMIQGIAPYWRVALEPHWGNHWLEFGAYGMTAKIRQWDTSQFDSNGWQLPVFLTGADQFKDVAFDAQYQYQGPNYWLTLRGTYIHEDQTLDATFGSGGSTFPQNWLDTFRGEASLAYGNDNRVVLTAQYFSTKGSTDPGLYGGLASQFDLSAMPTAPTVPDSNGYVFELSYIPYISSQAPLWPWANMRLGLQYTYYNKFDGQSSFAHDNNTLFLYAWFAM